MTPLQIIEPIALRSINASRGTGATNLGTASPKEVWMDTGAGTATIAVDMGALRTIDTIFLGHIGGSDAATSWTITTGVGAGETALIGPVPARVPDAAGDVDPVAHALWTGAPIVARYLWIRLTQQAAVPLSAGVLVIGRAFVTQFGNEWGAGRQPIDTGTATSLPDGGFAIVEGVRKLLYSWTFGDLSVAETEQLEGIALRLGETRCGVVIEDAERSAGLRRRIRYGLFKKWRIYERRNRRQTRWEISIEDWV